jgi:hypothetical protein
VLLQNLPARTFYRLIRSITWIEVDAALPIKNPLRRFVSRVVRSSRRGVSVRQSCCIIGKELLRIRTRNSAPPMNRLRAMRGRTPTINNSVINTKEMCPMANRWLREESRWGDRVKVNIPVHVSASAAAGAVGYMENLSLSGAFVKADVRLGLHSLIEVSITIPSSSRRTETVTAYVSRKVNAGIGIEWCEFAPSVVKDLLRSPSIRLPC